MFITELEEKLATIKAHVGDVEVTVTSTKGEVLTLDQFDLCIQDGYTLSGDGTRWIPSDKGKVILTITTIND